MTALNLIKFSKTNITKLLIIFILLTNFIFFNQFISSNIISVKAESASSQCNTTPLWADEFTDGWDDRFSIVNQYDTENRSIIVDPIKGPSLRVTFDEGSRNPGPTGSGIPGGTGFRAKPFTPREQACVSFDVKFGVDFDFVRGGKLPGLGGGRGNTGGAIPDGTDGFSARHHWREDGDLEAYLYLPSSINHGSRFGAGSFAFVPDIWYNVTQYLKMNTIGQADGVVKIYVDDNLVFSKSDLVFRTVETLQIDQIIFESFFGGSDDSWSAVKDEYIDFSNLAVFEEASNNPIEISLKVLLEGALINNDFGYSDIMRKNITQFNPNLDNNYVDEVTIEILDEQKNILESQDVLLDQSGNAFSKNELSSTLRFLNITSSGDFYLNIKHRNHVGVGSLGTVRLENNTINQINLTTNNNTINQNQKNLPNGKFALYFGNSDTNKSVRNSGDRNAVLNANSEIFVYSDLDINMDGVVNSTDRNLVVNNESLIQFLN